MTSQMKPTYILNVWLGNDNRAIFREIRNVPAYMLFKQYPIQTKMIGLRATVIVVTDDIEVTEQQKQAISINFMFGNYEETIVDLDKLEVRHVKGVNLIENPR